MARYLVTGGAGFIGSHISEELVRQDLGEVVILDDFSSGREENIAHLRGVCEFVEGDIRKLEDVKKAVDGVDYIFHEAAFVSAFDSYNKPELTHDINIAGTYNLLEVAAGAGVKRVVLASSAAVYGTESEFPNAEEMLPKPESPYAISKVCNEYHARMFSQHRGLHTVCLRYFNVYGPRQDPSSEYSGVISRFVEKMKDGRGPVVYGDGTQTRDFIFVKDVVKANIKAMLSDSCGYGEFMNIGTGKETSLLDLIDAIRKNCKCDFKPEFEPWREGDIKRSVASIEHAKDILDFSPATDLKSGTKQLLDYVLYGECR